MPATALRPLALESVLDAVSAALLALDADGNVMYVNSVAESLLQISGRKALHQSLDALVHHNESLAELCSRSHTEHKSFLHREIELLPRNLPGVVLVCDVAVAPLDDDLVLLELRDVASGQRIQDETQLLSTHGIGRQIVRQLAHEIKNPLGGLRGAAQLLQRKLDDLDGSGSLGEYTNVIIREADRLVSLVDTMLGPTGPLQLQTINIHQPLDHVCKLLGAEAGASVSVRTDYDPSLPEISIDTDRIIQMLLNLGRNALQAVEQEGEVILRTRAMTGLTLGERRHPLVLRIDVEDSGGGVPAEVRETLFFPLVTSRPGGTGLGLAIAQDVVQRHGGLVKLMPGERTLFSIFLPFSATEPNAG